MKILAEKETGMGGKYVLVEFENEFYAHGTEADLNDKYGFPVNNCGSKEDVLKHCNSIAKLCVKNIDKYNNELQKGNSKGWELLIEHEQKEFEALTEFAKVLTA